VANNPLFLGLVVARTFESIESILAAGDAIRIEQGQNCTLLDVDGMRAGGSGIVLDYGAGGWLVLNGEFFGNG
jgi:hypothetical protein